MTVHAAGIQALSDDYVIFQQRDDLQRPAIHLSDMLPLLDAGAGRKTFLSTYDQMQLRKVFRVKGLYHAKVKGRPDKARENVLHVLCDENISNVHVLVCQRLFGYATSISYERMISQPDSEVWRYARDKQFDLIVTVDKRNVNERDLTRIAMDDWARVAGQEGLPRLLHLTGDATEARKFGRLAAGNLSEIFALRAAPGIPVMHLNQAGLHQGAPKKKGSKRPKQTSRRMLARAAMAAYVAPDPKRRIPSFR